MQIQIQIEKYKSLKRLELHMNSTRVESSQLLLLQARQLVLNRSFDVVIIVLLLLQSSTYCLGNANIPPPIQEFSNAKMCIWKRVMNKLNSQPLQFKMSH